MPEGTTQMGLVYRCPVCGAEVTVVSPQTGDFSPVCCNRPMVQRPGRVVFYFCSRCGAELAVVHEGDLAQFEPICCGIAMIKRRPAA